MASTVENVIIKHVFDNELVTAEQNKATSDEDFQSYVQLMNSERDEREYDWQSDIRIPEFASQILTQSSIDVDYFVSRDFTEVFLQDEQEDSERKAEAAKEVLNRTLNQRKLHHFLKFLRAKLINHLGGKVYAVAWWDKQKKKGKVRQLDEFGRELSVEELRKLGLPEVQEIDVITKDRFNYDLIDQRNFFQSSEYGYSLQPEEKRWISYRIKKRLSSLERTKHIFKYKNLEKVRELVKSVRQSEKPTDKKLIENQPVDADFWVYWRFGAFYVKVNEHDEFGNPVDVSYGIDENGQPVEGAEFVETVMVFADVNGQRELIKFGVSPFKSFDGEFFRPVWRGLCYIHPTEDTGIGDGKYGRDLQTAVDDSFNRGQDRTNMATMPTMLASRSLQDESDLYMEPEHVIYVDDVDKDFRELKISDDITGNVLNLQLLLNKMNQMMGIYPNTMGQLPGFSSTTATAVAGSEQRTNKRGQFKALMFEYTFLCELYWMILQLTWKFAEPETLLKLAGSKAYDFDPSREYMYKPVSQSIESESSKELKVDKWNTILRTIVGIGHPDAVKAVNYCLEKMFTYMGDDVVKFGKALFDTQIPIEQRGQADETGTGTVAAGTQSNQNGIDQSQLERQTRQR